jgi:lactate dehydrogenase-like 2-hydroxyacid dehydrogenase
MNKPVVAVLVALRPSSIARLEQSYRVVNAFRDPVGEIQASGLADEVRAIVTVGAIGAPDQLRAILPHLRFVCVFGAGYEKVDVPALKAIGIRTAHARGANAACVADMAMALMLSTALKVNQADRYVREGHWDRVPPRNWTAVRGIGGSRVGIFGLGEIGQRIAQRAQAFDTEVAYHNRKPKPGAPWRYFDSLTAMAAWADHLIVACPLTEATHHAVNAEVLDALGPGGTLVNIARGAVVDEAALAAALRDGRIGGAGLDVLEQEPKTPAELIARPNVILTPHIASVTDRGVMGLEDMMMANLDAHFAGQTPPGLLDS